MLERFKLLLKLEEKEGKLKPLRHVVITTNGIINWAAENNKEARESYKKGFEVIKDIIAAQIELDIPIITISLLPSELRNNENFSVFLDELVPFFEQLKQDDAIHKNKVKISALGKWYDLPSRGIDAVKAAIQDTKDYDCFFLNFCINYNGQEEIIDACKLIGRQIKAGKIDIDSINKDIIKENIYTSYFLPPSLIIKNGKKKSISGTLLWDSAYAELHFTNKYFPDFKRSDFLKAIEDFQKR